MKEAMPQDGAGVAIHQDDSHRCKRRISRCSICTRRIWFEPTRLIEPEGVPTPRLSWVLCKECYQVLLKEMERSPILSPLRLRIAVGLVAAERWPLAYSNRMRTYMSDRRWIVFMAVGFIVAMLLHLAIIVMIAGISP